MVINLMGCLVGVKGNPALQHAFPHVDVFSPPSDPGPLIEHLRQADGRAELQAAVRQRDDLLAAEWPLPESRRGRQVVTHVPIVLGCSHACSFCIIPYRRGVERSRPVPAIEAEVRALAAQGVREVTLLGQIVDRYGRDLPDEPTLADLLRRLHDIEGLDRLRFLTSHPNWMTDDLLDAVASLPKVCEHFEVPVQSGDDRVLERMRRGYTTEDYRRLVERIRQRIPGASIATDIIVGFPGETEAQFQRTHDLLADLRLDVAHLARYSPRPGTVAARKMRDDVPEEEKLRRFRVLEDLQGRIAAEINQGSLGQTVEVLVEEQHRGRWKGRTRTNRLVFFESPRDWKAQLAPVHIEWAGPWSLIGAAAVEGTGA
jgi:tRNA-2-methylthio-N6-dimethylallyladenosine synthase